MSAKIFISYRRSDDPGTARLLYERLSLSPAVDEVFMDVDDMLPGVDFVQKVKEFIGKCDLLLVVIGPRWLSAKDKAGNRRLNNTDDNVRIEIDTALRLGKHVIPVLVSHADMPNGDDLPEDLKALATLHAPRLTHESFNADTQSLVKNIEKVFGRRPILGRLKVLLGAGAVAVAALAGAVMILDVPLYVPDNGDMSRKTIVAWNNVIDIETQDNFDKFLEQNKNDVVKITASASPEIVEVEQDGLKKKCIISLRGKGYVINCLRHLSEYSVKGFFTQRPEYLRRNTVFVEFEQVPDHDVIMANPKPKIVPYKP